MCNVYDLAEFKKRKKKQKITNFFQKYNKSGPFLYFLIASTSIMIWTIFSLKAVLLFLGVVVLVPVIFSKNKDAVQIQPSSINFPSFTKPQ